jgi:hypothetical protein
MDRNAMFAAALGLQAPWFVKKIKFSSQEHRLAIEDYISGILRSTCQDKN